jgi:hypothetical protein
MDFEKMAAILTLLVIAPFAIGAILVIRDTVRRKGRWGVNLRRVHCPACHTIAPVIRPAANPRQALWGGWTCQNCGVEFDKWGMRMAGGDQVARS